jgi:hypothetical protein
MGTGILLEKPLRRSVVVTGRQIAGRDYDHESQCLACWDGGDLICCDFCPAAYHPACVGVRCASELPFSWSCPHHACIKCERKATQVGGLLFRCSVCPGAWCEDHLNEGALIVGACDRFGDLGFRHPRQGCYVLCSGECKTWALTEGLLAADSAEDYATAAAIIGATGVDTTSAAAAARNAAKRAKEWARTDDRTARERLDQPAVANLELALTRPSTSLFEAVPHAWDDLRKLTPAAIFLLHDITIASDAAPGTNDGGGGWEVARLSEVEFASRAAKNEAVDKALAALSNWRGPELPDPASVAGGSKEPPKEATDGKSPSKSPSKKKADARAKVKAAQTEALCSYYLDTCRALEGERTDIVQVRGAAAVARAHSCWLGLLSFASVATPYTAHGPCACISLSLALAQALTSARWPHVPGGRPGPLCLLQPPTSDL